MSIKGVKKKQKNKTVNSEFHYKLNLRCLAIKDVNYKDCFFPLTTELLLHLKQTLSVLSPNPTPLAEIRKLGLLLPHLGKARDLKGRKT